VSEDGDRLAELKRCAAEEREALAVAVEDIREEIERRKTRWKVFGALAGGAAAAGTIGWKLLGSSSPAARIGKAASVASVGLGVARGLIRLRRFL
jgi:hypothetical protein